MTRKKRRTMGGVCMGLAVGVVVLYYVIIGHHSGTELGRLTLDEGTINTDYFRRSVTFVENESTHSTGPIHLEPGMNPLRAILDISRAGTRRSASSRLSYDVRLLNRDGEEVWKDSGSHHDSSDKKDSTYEKLSIALDVLDIQEPGDYVFSTRFSTEGQASLGTGLGIKVRRNVKLPDKRVMIAGGVVFLLGIVLYIAGYDRKEIFEEFEEQKRRERAREQAREQIHE